MTRLIDNPSVALHLVTLTLSLVGQQQWRGLGVGRDIHHRQDGGGRARNGDAEAVRQAAPRPVRGEGSDPAVDGHDAPTNPIAGRVDLLGSFLV